MARGLSYDQLWSRWNVVNVYHSYLPFNTYHTAIFVLIYHWQDFRLLVFRLFHMYLLPTHF